MEYNCPVCKKIIVEDIERYLEKYPNEEWMACPYCGYHFPLKKVREDL